VWMWCGVGVGSGECGSGVGSGEWECGSVGVECGEVEYGSVM
jgi:hypothetical protein